MARMIHSYKPSYGSALGADQANAVEQIEADGGQTPVTADEAVGGAAGTADPDSVVKQTVPMSLYLAAVAEGKKWKTRFWIATSVGVVAVAGAVFGGYVLGKRHGHPALGDVFEGDMGELEE